MTSPENDRQKSLFKTPNPEELKEQAQENPILNQHPSSDTDADDEDLESPDSNDEANSYFRDEETRAPSSSPIINANLSGH